MDRSAWLTAPQIPRASALHGYASPLRGTAPVAPGIHELVYGSKPEWEFAEALRCDPLVRKYTDAHVRSSQSWLRGGQPGSADGLPLPDAWSAGDTYSDNRQHEHDLHRLDEVSERGQRALQSVLTPGGSAAEPPIGWLGPSHYKWSSETGAWSDGRSTAGHLNGPAMTWPSAAQALSTHASFRDWSDGRRDMGLHDSLARIQQDEEFARTDGSQRASGAARDGRQAVGHHGCTAESERARAAQAEALLMAVPVTLIDQIHRSRKRYELSFLCRELLQR